MPYGDHPREYGENTAAPGKFISGQGPSPRIRGESPVHVQNGGDTRTIPANTGRIVKGNLPFPAIPDHPREYGENQPAISDEDKQLGPSPRIRGEWYMKQWADFLHRTIPANTGRILPRTCSFRSLRDHPREYGENRAMGDKKAPMWGPSPRIRGEWLARHVLGHGPGTIPANTGRI